jgi:hypothetical protein
LLIIEGDLLLRSLVRRFSSGDLALTSSDVGNNVKSNCGVFWHLLCSSRALFVLLKVLLLRLIPE